MVQKSITVNGFWIHLEISVVEIRPPEMPFDSRVFVELVVFWDANI